jgi:hypothetical protein
VDTKLHNDEFFCQECRPDVWNVVESGGGGQAVVAVVDKDVLGVMRSLWSRVASSSLPAEEFMLELNPDGESTDDEGDEHFGTSAKSSPEHLLKEMAPRGEPFEPGLEQPQKPQQEQEQQQQRQNQTLQPSQDQAPGLIQKKQQQQ